MPPCRKGFVSAYFLAIFLFLSLYTAVLADNVRSRAETIINLRREQEYFTEEYPAIREVMCQLQKEKQAEDEAEETEDAEESEDAQPAGYEMKGNTILLDISGMYPEQVLITVDQETMKVIDYLPVRNEGQ